MKNVSLIKNALRDQQKKKKLWHVILDKLNDRIEVEFKVPQYDFYRGKIFCSDLKKLSEVDDFSIYNLIDLLYEDFLRQIRWGYDATVMLNRIQKIKKGHYSEVDFVEASNHHYVRKRKSQKMVKVTYWMSEEDVLRGAVFLNDLHELDSSFSVDVDDFISLLFLEFITELKRGNQKEFLKKIIKQIDE